MSLGCEEPAQHTLSISLHGGGFYLNFFFLDLFGICVLPGLLSVPGQGI